MWFLHATVRKNHAGHRLVGAVNAGYMYADVGVAAAAWNQRLLQPGTVEKWMFLDKDFAQTCRVGIYFRFCVL